MNKICRNSHLIGIELQTGQSQLIFYPEKKKLASFPYCFKIGLSFFKHQRSVDNKRSKDSCDTLLFLLHYQGWLRKNVSHQLYQIFQEKSKERKGNHPIIRQQSGWVGSEKGKLLLTFSTIYADAGWVRKSKKRADVT